MKKKLGLIPLIGLLFVVGCRNTEVDTEPVIEGTAGIECIVNSTVDLLNGVIAYDKEDGDITASMNISITPHVNVFNGYANFDKAGSYKASYAVKDSKGNEASKTADIIVVDRDVYMNFAATNGFYTKAAGHALLDKGGMYNNIYSIVAHNCEVAEDVSLNRVYELDKGYEYTFRYFLSSETAGKIRICVDGHLADEKNILVGDNTIEFKYRTDAKNFITISLLLGALGEKVNCEFKGAELERPQETGYQDLLNGFMVEGRFDGTKGNAFKVAGEESAKLEITEASSAIWRGGMFLSTNISMEIGVEYIVSFDIERKELENCEVVLQNQQWDEKKYDTIFVEGNQHTTKHEVSYKVTEENKGSLWLYVQSGTSVNEITISNLRVLVQLDKVKKEYFTLSDFSNANDGFNCEFESFAGGFKYTIETFADTDWMQKVTSPEFYIDGSGSNYIITFKAKASAPTDVVFAAPIVGGWDPTWVWSKITITEEENVYTFVGNADGSDRYNVFVWQFGSTKNQKNKNVTIEISDIQISYKNSAYD
ncbi:MAG: DUF5011 domain-containing protein [Roseburia sp.]|nr:DUF5011 domain-containing protein [Anaeroplasma bactoclasticum]MCM1196572.1 DUF5011 domain-containing protein [Roseburia sp.]MCM1557106.1 DUF5011 domain-containing protein [Anaeroplasma bactoclasticum]